MKVSVLNRNPPPVSSLLPLLFSLFPSIYLLLFFNIGIFFFFLLFPFLPVRLNACLQLHLGCMRENWVGDLVGFVSLEITNVWEVTKVV